MKEKTKEKSMNTKWSFFNGYNIQIINQETEYLKWRDTYSLGIKMIDDQHIEILNFVNDLLNNGSNYIKDNPDYFKEVIGRTVCYIKSHFANEERIMKASKFPYYNEHKKAHNEFTMTVIKSVKDYEEGRRLVLTNFANFLRNWVLAHIAVMDMKYTEHFKNISICCTFVETGLTVEDIIMTAFSQPSLTLLLCPQCHGLCCAAA